MRLSGRWRERRGSTPWRRHTARFANQAAIRHYVPSQSQYDQRVRAQSCPAFFRSPPQKFERNTTCIHAKPAPIAPCYRSWRRAPPHGARRSAGSLFQAAADGAAAARGAARTRGSASIAAASPAAGVFVSPDWLQRNLEQVVVFDARGRVAVGEAGADGGGQEVTYIADYDAYLAGHISGASFINWTVDGVDASSDVPVQLQASAGRGE